MRSTNDGNKTIFFIRHGVTESNEYLSKFPWGSPGFIDPQLYDTVLSTSQLSKTIALLSKHESILESNNFEVVFTSPLTRTLQTTDLMLQSVNIKNFPNRISRKDKLEEQTLNMEYKNGIYVDVDHDKLIPIIATPLLSERLYLASDVGRSRNELFSNFPLVDFSLLPADMDNPTWWYQFNDNDDKNLYIEWRPPGLYACPGEPEISFRNRMIALREFIASRSETSIVMVTHWGVLRALTGKSVENCEGLLVSLDELLDEPFIDP
eukprot:gene9507-12807_t